MQVSDATTAEEQRTLREARHRSQNSCEWALSMCCRSASTLPNTCPGAPGLSRMECVKLRGGKNKRFFVSVSRGRALALCARLSERLQVAVECVTAAVQLFIVWQDRTMKAADLDAPTQLAHVRGVAGVIEIAIDGWHGG